MFKLDFDIYLLLYCNFLSTVIFFGENYYNIVVFTSFFGVLFVDFEIVVCLLYYKVYCRFCTIH